MRDVGGRGQVFQGAGSFLLSPENRFALSLILYLFLPPTGHWRPITGELLLLLQATTNAGVNRCSWWTHLGPTAYVGADITDSLSQSGSIEPARQFISMVQ